MVDDPYWETAVVEVILGAALEGVTTFKRQRPAAPSPPGHV